MKRKAKVDGIPLREFDSFLSTELYVHLPKELGYIISSYHTPTFTSLHQKKTIKLKDKINNIIPYKNTAYVFCHNSVVHVLDSYGSKIRQFELQTGWCQSIIIQNDIIYVSRGDHMCVYDLNGVQQRSFQRSCTSINIIMNGRFYGRSKSYYDIVVCDMYGKDTKTIQPYAGHICDIVQISPTMSVIITHDKNIFIDTDGVLKDSPYPYISSILSSDRHSFVTRRDKRYEKYVFAVSDVYGEDQFSISIKLKHMCLVDGDIWTRDWMTGVITVYECLIK